MNTHKYVSNEHLQIAKYNILFTGIFLKKCE